MKICHRHDEVYNEQVGNCPTCDLPLSDPMRIQTDDIVAVDNGDNYPLVVRGRVERVGKDGTWIIYNLDDEQLMYISCGCVVTKLEETYDNARRS